MNGSGPKTAGVASCKPVGKEGDRGESVTVLHESQTVPAALGRIIINAIVSSQNNFTYDVFGLTYLIHKAIPIVVDAVRGRINVILQVSIFIHINHTVIGRST